MNYFDTCIWLNFFKKEKLFFKKFLKLIKIIEKREEKIIVSTIILKELYFNSQYFSKIKNFLFSHDLIEIIKTTKKDYELARLFERKNKKLSFYDYLHVAICKRLNLKLITRDKALHKFAKTKIKSFKPNQLIH